MKHLFSILLLLVVTLFVWQGCSSDDETTNPPNTDVAVSSVNPVAGGAGTTVTITGSNFGTDKNAVTVQFGSINAAIVSITATEIVVQVPVDAVIGATTIKVTKDGKSSTANFTVNDPIVGAWKAEGLNVSLLLYGAPFKIRKIVATFNANGSYSVVQTDSAGTNLTLTGTWTTAAGNAPAPKNYIRTVTVNQTAPTSVTAEGIYEVTVGTSGVTMKYEIVQTQPPLTGVTKPTPTGGFGSSAGGAYGTALVQTYTKQ